MEARVIEPTAKDAAEDVMVAKRDLVAAWVLLEKVVVSLRKIGSTYAIPEGQQEQTPEQRRQMLEALDKFFGAELLREMSRARQLLVQYLPGEEAEQLSEHAIPFWSAGNSVTESATK